jgi:antitoxin component YwqK of YwqJK toxin-antitoxin module
MNFTKLPLLLIIILFAACDHVNNVKNAVGKKVQASNSQQVKEEKPKKQSKKDGLVVNKRKDGSVLSEITLKEGKMHGPAKDFYADGTLHAEFSYVDGLLEDELKWYHKNGKLYKITPYLHGKIHGTEKIHNTEGKLMAELPYKNGFPGMGLKEYSSEGNLVAHEVKVVVEEIDNIVLKGEYLLKIYLSDKSKNVKFYTGNLTEGKYMNDDLIGILTKDGIGEIRYAVPPGFYAMEKLNIIAEKQTKQGSKYITQTKYNLAIENKGI